MAIFYKRSAPPEPRRSEGWLSGDATAAPSGGRAEWTSRDRGQSVFARKGQLAGFLVEINGYRVTGSDLSARQQAGKRIDYVALYCAFQVPCSVLVIGALVQQELFGCVAQAKGKVSTLAGLNAALDCLQLQVEYAAHLLVPQAAEHYDLIDPVHELGREFPASGLERCLIYFLVDLVVNQ